MQFYQEKLVREKKKNGDYLENDDWIFKDYRPYMRVYQPTYNLFFLPTHIIFLKRVDLTKLRDKISEKYGLQANIILAQPPQH